MSTGSDLETAISAAARHYANMDKCELAKQHTPRRFDNQHTAKAPIDFKGWYGPTRQPLYVEAKATSDGVIKFVPKDGDGIKENQLNAMRDAVTRGIRMVLVADFVREGEVYVIDVKHVVAFADAPWKKSLSLFWCRAVGELAKVSGEGKHRRVWFLDTIEHPEHAMAGLAIAAEKAKSGSVELFPAELKAPKRVQARLSEPMPGPNTDAYRERIMRASDAGLKRAMGSAAGKWKPKRKTMWGK